MPLVWQWASLLPMFSLTRQPLRRPVRQWFTSTKPKPWTEGKVADVLVEAGGMGLAAEWPRIHNSNFLHGHKHTSL